MPPRRARKSSTVSSEELQGLYDLPSEIKQRDLEEILETQDRVRVARDDLKSLWAQLETQLVLGLRVEPGRLSVVSGAYGSRKIVEGETETAKQLCGPLSDEDIPF